jgi:acetyltransferase-like isoleucine patch superfamily enzyme
VLQRVDGHAAERHALGLGHRWAPSPHRHDRGEPKKMSLHGIQRRACRYRAVLRARYWRFLHPGLDVGPSVRVGRGCRLFLDPHARLQLGAGCEVDDATTIAVYGDGRIALGPGSFVGHHCTLAARAAIEIGPGTYLGELVSVRDHDHTVGALPSSGEMAVDPVVIGPNVWIGAKATVLRGARIGEGAVIGANAVVRGELPARSVCAGVPARVIRLLDPESGSTSERLAADETQ